MMKRSRSVFEPRTVPMCADFEDAGVAGAMSRLLTRLRQMVNALALPAWLWTLDFSHAVTQCAAHPDVPGLVRAMAETTHALGGEAEDEDGVLLAEGVGMWPS